MDIAIGLIIIFTLVWFWRIKRKALLTVDFKYKLHALHDELRWKAINNEIDSENWIYKYIDNSIPVTANNLTYFNLYSAIGLGLLHSKDKKFHTFKSAYYKQIHSKDNVKLMEIDYAFYRLILEYVIRKHIFFRMVFGLGVLIAKSQLKKDPPKTLERKISNLRHYPETSVSGKYMMPC